MICRHPPSRPYLFHIFAVLLSGALSACGSSHARTTDAGTADAGSPADVRNTRYCEILIGFITGTNVHVDVYNTEGLNDCPQDAWNAVNVSQVQRDFSADVVLLNGPRYWMIDSFGDSKLQNTTVKTVGGIQMRQAGAIDTTVGNIQAMQAPYSLHTIQRNTDFIWDAGQSVFELVDPAGHVYTMQSYSLQKNMSESIDTLANLGAQLSLPMGWTYRTRVLSQQLEMRSMNGVATVANDQFDNTYTQSQ